jgi:hypothetical protein
MPAVSAVLPFNCIVHPQFGHGRSAGKRSLGKRISWKDMAYLAVSNAWLKFKQSFETTSSLDLGNIAALLGCGADRRDPSNTGGGIDPSCKPGKRRRDHPGVAWIYSGIHRLIADPVAGVVMGITADSRL